jgi:hypothetical protein
LGNGDIVQLSMTAIRLLGSVSAVLVLATCSAERASDHQPLQVVVDGQSVFVLRAYTRDEATAEADAACAQRGAVAVFHGIMQYRAYRIRTQSAWFECVPRKGAA